MKTLFKEWEGKNEGKGRGERAARERREGREEEMKGWEEERRFSFLLLHNAPNAAHSSPHRFYILMNIQLRMSMQEAIQSWLCGYKKFMCIM